jgi:Fe-S-cluster containining protein
MAFMDALDKARELLVDVTPLKSDCGRSCGGACCQSDVTGENGMLLFPGEERYYEGCSWARIAKDRLGSRLVCQSKCPREARPLACRIFPLAILLAGQEDGGIKANITMDVRAWPVCPLMKFGRRGLDEVFVGSVEQAARMLMEDNQQRLFLQAVTEEIQAYKQLKQSFFSK